MDGPVDRLRDLLAEAERRRQDAETTLADVRARVDDAQMLANMGDYDWHIATDTNRWSDQLFRIYGYEPGAIDPSYQVFLAHIHPDDRERIQALHQHAYATGEPYQMIERIVRADGEVRYLSSNGCVIRDDEGNPLRMRGTCIDVTDRVLAEQAKESSEADAARFREAQVRRRQALEINDNVVQGLTAGQLALERGDVEAAASYLARTLDAARQMMSDLLDPLDGEPLTAGDLVRVEPARLDGGGAVADPLEETRSTSGGRRVLVVDDSEDVRMLLALTVASWAGYEVVGEAADGRDAVELAARLQPDVVLLDLAMPVMDGLEALPLIRQEVPHVKVLVLSGFDRGAMAERALAAGADRYVEKGVLGPALHEVVESLFAIVSS